MIRVVFSTDHGDPGGFRISGHAGAGSEGSDIVCAAVSSAAYMTANTITDILRVQPEIEVHDGVLGVFVAKADRASCDAILRGLMLHLTALAGQYPKNIHISFTEV